MKSVSKFSFSKNRLLIVLISFVALLICFAFCNNIEAQAKTVVITTPSQLRDINWKNKGFGPGNTYIIGNDMTLGDGDDATCILTKGKFTIDFNGHTVQNANNALGVFSLRGADVTMKDSKVKSDKPSVRSYGAGAIDMTAGKLTIQSGNYVGLSNGTNNPAGLHVGGGTCVVNNGFIGGDTIGADCAGGTLYINGGTFQTNYMFALADFGGGNIHISKARFISGQTTYGYHFAIGAYSPNNYYDFSKWLAKGSSFSQNFQVGYWNMQASVTAYPTMANYYAVSYETPELSVTSSVRKPTATALSSVKAGKKSFTAKWKKKSGITGYQLQYATNKGFNKSVKTITVSNAKTASKTVKKLKSKKKYYVRVRTYKSFNGTKLYSGWSTAKTVKTK